MSKLIVPDLWSARLRAIDKESGFPFLAEALYAMHPIITETVETCACDEFWRLYVSPTYFNNITPDQGAMSLVHEVWHLLRCHFTRSRSLGVPQEKHRIANIAQDLEINQGDDLWERLPSFVCTPDKYKVKPGLIFEEYWHLLKDREDLKDHNLTFGKIGSNPGGGNCGSCSHGFHSDFELPPPSATGPDKKRVPGVSEPRGQIIIKRVAEEMHRYVGNVPEGWQRWAKDVVKPKVNWRDKISPAIEGIIFGVSGQSHQDHRRLSRRQHLSPDILRPATVGDVPIVAVIIDASGSVDDHELSYALAEIDNVLLAYGFSIQVAAYSVDAASAPVQMVTSARDIHLIGGGGTDMGQGFLAIEEDVKKGVLSKYPIVIVITDGYTPWPTEIPEWLQSCFIVITHNVKGPKWAVPPRAEVLNIKVDD